jgi:mannose-6-phosphate isomerase-like protein (cupin superfamily)
VHNHAADEVAIGLRGRGAVIIDGVEHRLYAGDVVFTPAWSQHVTRSDENEPTVVLWIYAPPGSERRWLAGEN